MMLRDYHQSCLDRGFYYPHLMKRYGDRPIQIQPPSEWAVFPGLPDSPDTRWTFMKAFVGWLRWFWVAFLVVVSFFAGKEYERRRWSETIMATYDWSLRGAYEKGLRDCARKARPTPDATIRKAYGGEVRP